MTDARKRLIGTMLDPVHQALAADSVEGVGRFHWVNSAATHLAMRPWTRPAVVAAVQAVDALNLATLS